MLDFISFAELGLNELWGFVACSLVLATFAMGSMRRLRFVAILSNIAFIYYAAALGLLPIFVLHAILLPLNLWRLLALKDLDAENLASAQSSAATSSQPPSEQATILSYPRTRASALGRAA